MRYFEVREEAAITVVKILVPKIIEDEDVQALGEQLFNFAYNREGARVLIDWSRVDYVNCAFLGKLIAFDKKLRDRGGRLVLCGLRREIYQVFRITKLNRLFDIKDTEADGLLALSS